MLKEKLLKYLSWGVIALIVYMPFHVFLTQWLSLYTGGIELWKIGKDVVTAILTVAVLTSVFLYKKQTRLFIWIFWLTLLYGLLHLGYVLFDNEPLNTGLLASTYNLRIFCYVIIGYGVALLVPKFFTWQKIFKILIIVSTIVCLFGVAQAVLPSDVLTNFGYSEERGAKPNFYIDDNTDLPRIFSTIREPNSLGAYMVIMNTFILAFLIQHWRTDKRLLLLGLFMLHFVVLFLTYSRGAMIAAFLSYGLLLLLLNQDYVKRNAKKIILVLLGVFAFLAIAYLWFGNSYFVQNVVLHTDSETQSAVSSNEAHLSAKQDGLSELVENPVGLGPGSAGPVAYHSGGLITENYYLQIGLEVGLLGLLLFLGFLTLILRELWRHRSAVEVKALLGIFVGLLALNMLYHTFVNEVVALSAFFLVGLLLGRAKQKRVKHVEAPK